VLDCDGGDAGVSASFLNICGVNSMSHPEQIRILRSSTHLHEYRRRLPSTDGPFPIDDREWHACYTFRTRLGYLMVHLGQAFVGFQEAYCLRKQTFNSATRILPDECGMRGPSKESKMEDLSGLPPFRNEGHSRQLWT